jgi:hypothetical protein
MPLTLNVGVSRKVGLPNYASLGASCSTQLELDPVVLSEPEILRKKIEHAFKICRQAVDVELAKSDTDHLPARLPIVSPVNGSDDVPIQGDLEVEPPLLATERQVEFLYQLARQIRGLGGQRLVLVAEHRFGHSLHELSTGEASSLIDLLKEVRSGARPLADLLPEAAA